MRKNPKEKWTHMRLLRETEARLKQFRQERTDMDYPLPSSHYPRWDAYTSLDMIVRYLLDQIAEHRRRARLQRLKKRARNLIAETEAASSGGGANPMLTSKAEAGGSAPPAGD